MDDTGLLVGLLIGMPLGFILHFLTLHYQIYKSDLKTKLIRIENSLTSLHAKIYNNATSSDNKN